MTILVSDKGHAFLEFLEVEENEMKSSLSDAPLTHALVVAEYDGKYLLLYNTWRQHWELPGGVIDAGESARECAIREMKEETNQQSRDMCFKGLMKFQLKPDDRLEYGALYSCRLHDIQPFRENDEADQIVLWDLLEDIGYVDQIDKALIAYG
ncbi:NUDIX hydrolase [Halobacillus litoralis]|uniref:NUDIX hydrolase n=1 Tax=Halobacillus litoralis TaxID=45668 RepID=UPI001CD447BC|nr:NUDIX hydrolase [Halobacillus litoralis]MCA0970170.1 NUDIX hydrolase [Halobacillus litoralis]